MIVASGVRHAACDSASGQQVMLSHKTRQAKARAAKAKKSQDQPMRHSAALDNASTPEALTMEGDVTGASAFPRG